jgi:hypothetical protein
MRARIEKDGPRSVPGTFYWKVIDLTRGYAIMTALDSAGGAVRYAETRGYTVIGEDCCHHDDHDD